jgi:hypothetical protein
MRTVVVACVLWAGLARGADGRGYEPLGDGARRTYETTSSLSERVRFTYDVVHQKTAALPDGAERVVAHLQAANWVAGEAVERDEQWVREPRGVFTFNGKSDATAATDWGPTPLLPAAPELEQTDHVWHFDGERALPFALGMLGLLERNPAPVTTSGEFHTLEIGPVHTPAGDFPRAVQVSSIERAHMSLRADQMIDLLMRCRRWYVDGVGPVREVIEFPDFDTLGRLTTELTAYSGLTPVGGGGHTT